MNNLRSRATLRNALRLLVVPLLLLRGAAAPAAAAPGPDEARTPPRLGLVEGDVSFWRPGAGDWAAARLNIPVVPGDYVATGADGSAEMQVGPRAYLRAGGDTEVGVEAQEGDTIRFDLRNGTVSLDARAMAPGAVYEVVTAQATLTLAAPGYVRIFADPTTTRVAVRRGGRVGVTEANGTQQTIGPDEAIVLEPAATVQSALVAAPALDDWDRWNFERTDTLVAPASAAYVPAEVYGTAALDQYGSWSDVPAYGSVWVPSAVAPGWVPYTTGRWIWDPYYGWTWVDDAPWGWAPFHYGRWVYVNGYWAWAPGPRFATPVYSPALVAFFGGGGVNVDVGVPFVSWVALGWGEPVRPWWGPSWFVGRPCWAGWSGPRIVNNPGDHNPATTVNGGRVGHPRDYANVRFPGGVVAMRRDLFGRAEVVRGRIASVDLDRSQAFRGGPPAPSRPGGVGLALSDGRRPVNPGPEGVSTGQPAAQAPSRALGDRGGIPTRQAMEQPERYVRQPGQGWTAPAPAASVPVERVPHGPAVAPPAAQTSTGSGGLAPPPAPATAPHAPRVTNSFPSRGTWGGGPAMPRPHVSVAPPANFGVRPVESAPGGGSAGVPGGSAHPAPPAGAAAQHVRPSGASPAFVRPAERGGGGAGTNLKVSGSPGRAVPAPGLAPAPGPR